jgi:hypothetical protein
MPSCSARTSPVLSTPLVHTHITTHTKYTQAHTRAQTHTHNTHTHTRTHITHTRHAHTNTYATGFNDSQASWCQQLREAAGHHHLQRKADAHGVTIKNVGWVRSRGQCFPDAAALFEYSKAQGIDISEDKHCKVFQDAWVGVRDSKSQAFRNGVSDLMLDWENR